MKQAFLIFRRNKQLRIEILILFLMPILFNAMALWHDIGVQTLWQAISGNYVGFTGFVYNPLPEILFEVVSTSLILTALSLLVICIANVKMVRHSPAALKFPLRLFLILVSSVVFGDVSGFFMPLSWLPEFNDYLLGIPGSTFAVIGGWVFVFPATLIVLFLAIRALEKEFEEAGNDLVSLPARTG
jgi:hypothetical protein